jgi:subtilisin family serine protease
MPPDTLASFGLGRSAGNPDLVDAYDLIPVVKDGCDGLCGVAGSADDGYADDIVGENFRPTSAIDDALYPDPHDNNDERPPGSNIPNDARHGTWVAGIVGAAAGNDFGIAGVAPFVRLAIFRAVDEVTIQESIIIASKKHMDIANISQGAIPFTGTGDMDAHASTSTPDCDMTLGQLPLGMPYDLVDYQATKASEEAFYKGAAAASLLIVQAAGNCKIHLTSALRPEIHDVRLGIPGVQNVIGVTGIGEVSGALTDRTRPGPVTGADVIDIAAPNLGVGVVGSSVVTKPPGRFGISGTSFSAPFVAGAAALILAFDPSLAANPVGLKARILANADKMTATDEIFVGGTTFSGAELVRDGNRLNVCTALSNGLCPFPYVSPPPPSLFDGGTPSDAKFFADVNSD